MGRGYTRFMRKIVLTILLAVAGAALAQLPATMNTLGIGLPSNTYRFPADDCDAMLAPWAEMIGAPQYECFYNTSTYSLTFRGQQLAMQSARYEQVSEQALSDNLLYQQWEHRENGRLVHLLLTFEDDGRFGSVSFLWD